MKVDEMKRLVMDGVLEMAKKRQQECNHLDIGNYVKEHYNKIMRTVHDHSRITIDSDFTLFGKSIKEIKDLIDKERERK